MVPSSLASVVLRRAGRGYPPGERQCRCPGCGVRAGLGRSCSSSRTEELSCLGFFWFWFVFDAVPEGSRSKSAFPCFPCWGSGGAVPPECTARPTALPEPSLVLPAPGSCLCRGDRLVCPALCIPVSRDGLGVWQPERRKEMDLQVEKETGCRTARRLPRLCLLL